MIVTFFLKFKFTPTRATFCKITLFNFFVETTVVTIITESESTTARPIFATTAGKVNGNRIPQSNREEAVLNEWAVLITLVGIRWTFRLASCIIGGTVKTIAVKVLGIGFKLKNKMVGTKQMKVGTARTKLKIGRTTPLV